MARALQHLGRRDRLAAAYRVRQREHALVGVVQRGGGVGRRAWLCKRTTFTPRQTSIGSLFAQWLSGSVAHGPCAAHRKRLRVPTRDGPSRTQRCAWDYDNAAHGTTACGRTGGGMPCGGRKQHSVGAYEPKGRSRRTAGAPGAHPRRSTARGRRALGARSAPHRMRMRRQPWIPRGAPRTPCESVGPAATPAGLATAARAAAQRRRSDRGWTHAAAGCAAAVARGGPEMVRHDLACRLDGGVGLTLLVPKEAEEPANPQSHKCRGRQCASAPCVDAVLWDTMAREIAACGPH